MAEASPYLDAHGAVQYLQLGSLSALYRLIADHRLPYCRIGRRYRFDTRDLDAWLRGARSSPLELLRPDRRRSA